MDIYNSNKWVHRPIISFTSHRTELGHFSSEQLPILKSVVLLHIIIMFLYSLVNTFCNQNKITHSTHLSYFRSGCGRIILLFLSKGSRLRCLTTLANNTFYNTVTRLRFRLHHIRAQHKQRSSLSPFPYGCLHTGS